MVLVVAVLAMLRHKWTGRDSKLHRLGIVGSFLADGQRLQGHGFAAGALENHRLLPVKSLHHQKLHQTDRQVTYVLLSLH